MLLRVENIKQREGNKVEITKIRRWREEVEWEQCDTKPFISRVWKLEFPGRCHVAPIPKTAPQPAPNGKAHRPVTDVDTEQHGWHSLLFLHCWAIYFHPPMVSLLLLPSMHTKLPGPNCKARRPVTNVETKQHSWCTMLLLFLHHSAIYFRPLIASLLSHPPIYFVLRKLIEVLSCGWTSTELIFGFTLVTNFVGNGSRI